MDEEVKTKVFKCLNTVRRKVHKLVELSMEIDPHGKGVYMDKYKSDDEFIEDVELCFSKLYQIHSILNTNNYSIIYKDLFKNKYFPSMVHQGRVICEKRSYSLFVDDVTRAKSVGALHSLKMEFREADLNAIKKNWKYKKSFDSKDRKYRTGYPVNTTMWLCSCLAFYERQLDKYENKD